jgi:SAM-dependent methyltransferase
VKATGLAHTKLCEIADFRDPDLIDLMREAHSRGVEPGSDFPRGQEHRKLWEVGMTARALRDFGALGEEAEILGVGAGHEATIFWLTNHAKRVYATDLYAMDDSWSASDSDAGMLVNPEQYATTDWDPERLVVQNMDALELEYEDESFDGIFSSSSIEHFGTHRQVRRSIEEMYRVLKPGGVVALATEFRIEGPPPGLPGTILFNGGDLHDVLLRGLDWEPSEPLPSRVSDETVAGAVSFDEVIGGGSPGFPHLVLRRGPHLWTSMHLTLVKSESPRAPRAGSGLPASRRAIGSGLRARAAGLRQALRSR